MPDVFRGMRSVLRGGYQSRKLGCYPSGNKIDEVIEMENPCEKCREYDICQGKEPCKKNDAYLRLRERYEEICEKTRKKIQEQREKNNDIRGTGTDASEK